MQPVSRIDVVSEFEHFCPGKAPFGTRAARSFPALATSSRLQGLHFSEPYKPARSFDELEGVHPFFLGSWHPIRDPAFVGPRLAT